MTDEPHDECVVCDERYHGEAEGEAECVALLAALDDTLGVRVRIA